MICETNGVKQESLCGHSETDYSPSVELNDTPNLLHIHF